MDIVGFPVNSFAGIFFHQRKTNASFHPLPPLIFKPIKEIQVFISTRITPCDIITYKMTEQCNIELGNHRYVKITEWKDEVRIDIREWEMEIGARIPTRKRISLPLQRWKLLVDNFDSLHKALQEKAGYASHIGGNVYASVKPNNVCMDIRQHWLPPNQTGGSNKGENHA